MKQDNETITLNQIEHISYPGGEYLFTPYYGGTPEQVYEFLWFLSHEVELRNKWWNVKAGDMVFDIGCRLGSWTLPALAAGGTVWAIDPCRDSFFPLATQLFLNQFDTRCRHVAIMLGSETKMADFYATENAGAGEGVPEQRLMYTLDCLAQTCSKIDWIKIDVEGGELDVLQGAVQSLIKFSPTVIVEYHDHLGASSDKVRELMSSLGYAEELDGVHGLWLKA